MDRELKELGTQGTEGSGSQGAEEITQTLISAASTSDSDAIQAPLAGIELHRKWEARKPPAAPANRERQGKQGTCSRR